MASPLPDSVTALGKLAAEDLKYFEKEQERVSIVDVGVLEELLDYEKSPRALIHKKQTPHGRKYVPQNITSKASAIVGSQKIMLYSSGSGGYRDASSFRDLVSTREELTEFFQPKSADGVWWLDVHNPSEAILRLLCAAFGVHPLTVEDIWMRETQEKIEHYGAYYFTSIRSFHVVETDHETEYKPYSVYLIVLKDGTLTFSFTDNMHTKHVLDRIALLEDYIPMTSDWIFYALTDDIVDSFAKPIADIESRVNIIDDEVYTIRSDDTKAFLRKIESVRRSVLSLVRLLSRKPDVLRAFEKHHGDHTHRNDREPYHESEEEDEERPTDDDLSLYIGDVQDHVATMLSSLLNFEGLLARSQNNYLAQLEITNVVQRGRIFGFLRKITVITVVMTVMTMACGLLSTNVNANVPLYIDDSLTPWAIIVGAEVVVGLALVWLAKRFRFF